MCWSSTTKPIKKIAENNIHVFKVLRIDGNIISSYYNKFIWNLGKLECLDDEISIIERISKECGRLYTIECGFHSYSLDCSFDYNFHNTFYNSIRVFGKNIEYLDSYINDIIIADCIIPKGSIFYENEHGEIVSNKLYINKIIDVHNYYCYDKNPFKVLI